MAGFGESFAQGFNPSFSNTFSTSFANTQKIQREEAVMQAQKDIDTSAINDLQGVNAKNLAETEDRMGGFQTMSDLRGITKLTPAAGKAIFKGVLSEMETQGIKPAPEFTDWWSSAKEDERTAILDVMAEGAKKDPKFGRQKFIDTVSNSESFREILTQAATEANGTLKGGTPESGTTSSKNEAFAIRLASDKTIAQAQISRLLPHRNNFTELLVKHSTSSDGIRDGIKGEISRVDKLIQVETDKITAIVKEERELQKPPTGGDVRTLMPEEAARLGFREGSIVQLNEAGKLDIIQGGKEPIDQSTTLTAEEAKAKGFPEGSIVQQSPSGEFTVVQKGQETKAIEEKRLLRIESDKVKVDIVLGRIDKAQKLVDEWATTGFVGNILRFAGSTDARNLHGTLETIRANLGFTELQAMRDASPTGGALGQVAVREIEFLQATVASLDQAQDDATLTENLKAIKLHMENWKRAVDASFNNTKEAATEEVDVEEGQVITNPQSGEKLVFRSGKWQKP